MAPAPLSCHNMTVLLGSEDGVTKTYDNDSITTSQPIGNDDDINAVIYIVVVLLFYSMGIIIAIISYLKKERQEMVEEKAYDDYMNFRADPDKWRRYFRVQRMISHLNRVEEGRTAEEERQRKLERETSLSHSDKAHSIQSSFSLKFHRLSLIRKLSKGEKSPEIHVSVAQSELMAPNSPLVVGAAKGSVAMPRTPQPEQSCSKWRFPDSKTSETVFENDTPATEPKSSTENFKDSSSYPSIILPGEECPGFRKSLAAGAQEMTLPEVQSIMSDSQERINTDDSHEATSTSLSLETCL